MTAQVTVIVGRAQNVLTVPSTAVRRRGPNSFLDVLGTDGKPEQRKVTTGLDNKIVVEITSGLKAGERVVTTRSSGGPDATRPTRARRSPFGF
jgi:macrolide-specific efflux system membrane fusion protein